ncbi:H(+)-transporting V1 sector ATPase subunit F [Elasticomyces elasticus]|nr:H(+)-transporting V1 sector ATPase subunit F [Elasticomyces elasticus]KAK5761199.1 H(+)-transporting V1 sector ATPase subunit F [Elasticomyces elasticus]
MALPQSAYAAREFLAVIGDEHVTDPPDSQKNYLVVDQKTEVSTIEGAFDAFTKQRKDIAIVLINQHIADKIRGTVDGFGEAFPAVLEIPSKDHPYDPEKDSVMKRVRKLFGE